MRGFWYIRSEGASIEDRFRVSSGVLPSTFTVKQILAKEIVPFRPRKHPRGGKHAFHSELKNATSRVLRARQNFS